MKRRVETEKAKLLKAGVRGELLRLMRENKVSQAELARRLRVNRVSVKLLLRPGRNLTLDLLTRVVEALEGDICVIVTNTQGTSRISDNTEEVKRRQQEGGCYPTTEEWPHRLHKLSQRSGAHSSNAEG